MNGDNKLVQKVLEGKVECYREIVERYEKKVFSTCMGFVQNETEAKDLTQEIFVKIYNNLKNYRGSSSFSTWVYKISVNTCLTYLKIQKKLRCELSEEIASKCLEDPAEYLQAKELKEIIENEIQCLDEKSRKIFLRRLWENISFDSIAKRENCSPVAARVSFFRSKKRIRQKLGEYYGER